MTEHGFFNATTDIAVITKWWTDEPEANIGMPVGGSKKLFVIDVDPRDGGEESLEKLVAKLGALPKTAEQITGGGGRHIIFSYPGGPVPKELAPGVHLKADGGYIIVAPSLHSSGRRYQWDGTDGAKALLHPAEIPACYLAITTSANGIAQVFTEKIEKGRQHYSLVSLAGTMRKRGCGFEEIFAALMAFNLNRCTEPGPEKHIRRIAEGICKKAPGKIYEKPKIASADSRGIEDLMEDASMVMPELAIEGILPKQGLVLLGGRPKEGKSWLAAQMAIAFTTGEALGGWLRVLNPGRCQLWSLEDGYALTKDKVLKLLGGKRPDGLRDLRVVAELTKPLLSGGDQIIRATLSEHPCELLILDSLFKLTAHQQQKADICQRDYDVIDCVRRIALDHHCAAVIVMHTRKGASGGDPIENLMGTTGNTAAADAVCELKRNGNEAKLTIVGRLVEREDLELRWHDGEKWGWSIEGESKRGRGLGEVSEDILAFLQAEGASKPSVIHKAVKYQFNAVWMALQRLQAAGRIQKNADKKWEVMRGRE